jgi:DnaJ-class molecular chaperone
MTHQILCHCRGNPQCELCHGAKLYDYTPGERGWMPFTCPTCHGSGRVADADCFTCNRAGTIDPANPPEDETPKGLFRRAWQILFGG